MGSLDKDVTITFMSGPLDGRTMRFEQPEIGDELVINIGRREGCDVHLPFDNQVSRLHARLGCVVAPITATESVSEPFILSFWLEDMHSRNGTYVEREKQPLQARLSLRPGSLFRIGRTWMRLDEPLSL